MIDILQNYIQMLTVKVTAGKHFSVVVRPEQSTRFEVNGQSIWLFALRRPDNGDHIAAVQIGPPNLSVAVFSRRPKEITTLRMHGNSDWLRSRFELNNWAVVTISMRIGRRVDHLNFRVREIGEVQHLRRPIESQPTEGAVGLVQHFLRSIAAEAFAMDFGVPIVRPEYTVVLIVILSGLCPRQI